MDAMPARVRTFVLGTSLVSGSESMRGFFSSLSVDGWLIELARAHARITTGTMTHEEFGAWLGLRDAELGRGYRAMLKRADIDRDELVQVARRMLKAETSADLRTLQRSTEMIRFRRMREHVERRQLHTGRPTSACDTDGPIGKQIEKWRLELHVSVEDWSEGLGISAPTYRTRLAREQEPKYRQKLEQLVKDGKDLHNKLSTPLVTRHAVVDKDELAAAYSVVANGIEEMRAELIGLGSCDDEITTQPDGFLPLDLYSWMRPTPEQEEMKA